MQAGVVAILIVGWSLVLMQPFFSARRRKDYLRSIVTFRQQLWALETGIQSRPLVQQRSTDRPTRPSTAASVPPYRRRQRTLASLGGSLLIGLLLIVVAAPIGLLLTTISLVSIAVFLTLARASHNATRARPTYATSRQGLASSRGTTSERAIA
ncbi:hypothetical protein [Ferrimicrobium sp.]|uniref:hypothetical protein n=1 Tax=Ferrimicrobium sp. TaxID=2926050 RepID=UPI002635A123|nr:hypothetical protein [Ferrimicrobium sp.]